MFRGGNFSTSSKRGTAPERFPSSRRPGVSKEQMAREIMNKNPRQLPKFAVRMRQRRSSIRSLADSAKQDQTATNDSRGIYASNRQTQRQLGHAVKQLAPTPIERRQQTIGNNSVTSLQQTHSARPDHLCSMCRTGNFSFGDKKNKVVNLITSDVTGEIYGAIMYDVERDNIFFKNKVGNISPLSIKTKGAESFGSPLTFRGRWAADAVYHKNDIVSDPETAALYIAAVSDVKLNSITPAKNDAEWQLFLTCACDDFVFKGRQDGIVLDGRYISKNAAVITGGKDASGSTAVMKIPVFNASLVNKAEKSGKMPIILNTGSDSISLKFNSIKKCQSPFFEHDEENEEILIQPGFYRATYNIAFNPDFEALQTAVLMTDSDEDTSTIESSVRITQCSGGYTNYVNHTFHFQVQREGFSQLDLMIKTLRNSKNIVVLPEQTSIVIERITD